MSVQNIDFVNDLGILAIKELRVAYNHSFNRELDAISDELADFDPERVLSAKRRMAELINHTNMYQDRLADQVDKALDRLHATAIDTYGQEIQPLVLAVEAVVEKVQDGLSGFPAMNLSALHAMQRSIDLMTEVEPDSGRALRALLKMNVCNEIRAFRIEDIHAEEVTGYHSDPLEIRRQLNNHVLLKALPDTDVKTVVRARDVALALAVTCLIEGARATWHEAYDDLAKTSANLRVKELASENSYLKAAMNEGVGLFAKCSNIEPKASSAPEPSF